MRVQAGHKPRTRIKVDVRPATVVVRAVTSLRLPDLGDRRHARVEEIEIPSRVDYRLTVPRGMSLGLSGINSSISVEGVEGDVSAEVVNGSVEVRGGRGSVRLESINGKVTVIGARGSVEASSVNEGITLRDVAGRVRAESVNGNVDLLGIVSEAVEASTVSGGLRYEGALRAGGPARDYEQVRVAVLGKHARVEGTDRLLRSRREGGRPRGSREQKGDRQRDYYASHGISSVRPARARRARAAPASRAPAGGRRRPASCRPAGSPRGCRRA